MKFKRILPLGLLATLFAAAFYFDLHTYLSFEALKAHRGFLTQWVSENFVVACFLFTIVYTLAVAASIPGATLLTIGGGFLFGVFPASIMVVASATCGATILFSAVKTSFGDGLATRASGWMKKMEKGFCEDSFNYLLALRLVPLFPFWIVNIVPALVGVRLRTFMLATGLGIIPGSVVYVLVGNGLGAVIDQGGTPNFGIIFESAILAPLLGLAILSLIPVIYKKYQLRKRK